MNRLEHSLTVKNHELKLEIEKLEKMNSDLMNLFIDIELNSEAIKDLIFDKLNHFTDEDQIEIKVFFTLLPGAFPEVIFLDDEDEDGEGVI